MVAKISFLFLFLSLEAWGDKAQAPRDWGQPVQPAQNPNSCLDVFQEPPCGGQIGRCYLNPDGSIGGFVSQNATVQERQMHGRIPAKPFIEIGAQVCGHSHLIGQVHILDQAVVNLDQGGKIDGATMAPTTVKNNARVSGTAKILSGAMVEGNAIVEGSSELSLGARASENSRIISSRLRGTTTKIHGNRVIRNEEWANGFFIKYLQHQEGLWMRPVDMVPVDLGVRPRIGPHHFFPRAEGPLPIFEDQEGDPEAEDFVPGLLHPPQFLARRPRNRPRQRIFEAPEIPFHMEIHGDPSLAKAATDEEIKVYQDIKGLICALKEKNQITPEIHEHATNMVDIFEVFHRNNPEVCEYLAREGKQEWDKDNRIVVHAEGLQLRIEERAKYFFNLLDMAYQLAKEKGKEADFVRNALFYRGFSCLEGRSKLIYTWMETHVAEGKRKIPLLTQKLAEIHNDLREKGFENGLADYSRKDAGDRLRKAVEGFQIVDGPITDEDLNNTLDVLGFWD